MKAAFSNSKKGGLFYLDFLLITIPAAEANTVPNMPNNARSPVFGFSFPLSKSIGPKRISGSVVGSSSSYTQCPVPGTKICSR